MSRSADRPHDRPADRRPGSPSPTQRRWRSWPTASAWSTAARFWGDEIIAAYCEQRDAIREHSDRPVTTNLMLPYCLRLDGWAFARELDVVGCDQYPDANGLDGAAHVAHYADRSRSLAGGRPWLLMEHGTHDLLTGSPALTRHRFGSGQGWYLSTRLDDSDYGALVGRLPKDGGVEPEPPGLPAGAEAVTRHAADGRRWHVLINHTADAAPLPDPAHALLTGTTAHELPPGGCAVLRGH
ncbi:beta-galactosidase [Streptomyces sp. NPDC008086]|uniref:beta-galactosidase n=1 Tax=Streptomyces sp. NPDC008086 TaxID=3364807 RepID=UPI0036EAB54C